MNSKEVSGKATNLFKKFSTYYDRSFDLTEALINHKKTNSHMPSSYAAVTKSQGDGLAGDREGVWGDGEEIEILFVILFLTDVSVDSLDVRLRILQERREAAGAVGDIDVNEDDDEVEIIEVEEPFEPVPMQDSCLQVNYYILG